MSLNITMPATANNRPRISVIGVGGAGSNAVGNMIRSGLDGVEFIITNTDSQALAQSPCGRQIQLGQATTQGLGAGARPEVGRMAAEEALDDIIREIEGSNMLFVTAGMGGGTGTGAAPVIARAAREHGVLTVGVVTKPFQFEGTHRMRIAEAGIRELQNYVDTLIVIPNQNLFRIANQHTTFADAFHMADEVLYSGVRGVTDLMMMPGLINLDFNDIRTVMTQMGKAMMGTGEAEGEDRAKTASEAAISNPLLDDVSMKGATRILINFTGGDDLKLFEVDEAANRIRDEVDPEAEIIFGAIFDPAMTGKMRVSVIAAGMDVVAQRNDLGPNVTSLAAISAARVPSAMTVAAPAPVTAAATTVHRAPEFNTAGATAMAMQPAEAAMPHFVAAEPAMELATAMPVVAEPASQENFMAVSTPVSPAPAADTMLRAERLDEAVNPAAPTTVPQDRKRGPNLFARVTGGAAAMIHRAPSIATPAQPVAAPQAGYRPAMASAQPTVAPTTPATPAPQTGTAQPAMMQGNTARAVQPQLSGLDPNDRVAAARAEEEMLDIPAFLRRQAN